MKRGIFQVGSIFPLLFVLSMVPLPLILRKVSESLAELFVVHG